MTTYLLSLFHKNPATNDFLLFREQRLELARRHMGTVITFFQPTGRESDVVPDEIHIVEFPSQEACRAFQADARSILGERQSRVTVQSVDYESDVLIPTESVLATIITKRPDFLAADPASEPDLAAELTRLFPSPSSEELSFVQRQIEMDTVILNPQNQTQKRLSVLVPQWQQARDRKVIFAHTYYLMTGNMLTALQSGAFHNRKWVTRLLDRFAEYYFDALAKYEKAPYSAPSVWRVAFEVTENPEAFAVQNLLLGVNAHINFDLANTLIDVLKDDWRSLDSEQKRLHYEDHTLVNKTIETTFDEAQQLVIARYSPSLDKLMQMASVFDEVMVSSLIRTWREQAWQFAVEYLDAGSWEKRHAVQQKMEYVALRRADMIMLRQGPVKMKLLF